MAFWGESGKKPPVPSAGLPRLIGGASPRMVPPGATTPRQLPTLADRMWATTAAPVTSRPGSSRPVTHHGSGAWTTGSDHQRCSTAPSSTGDRPSSIQIMLWIEKELSIVGCQNPEPSIGRVRVFASAFSEVIDMLPSYRAFLMALQKEYDGLISRLQAEINAIAPLEGRVKTLKAESISFVGESMTWFQMELSCLRKQLAEAAAERDALRAERQQNDDDRARLIESSEKNQYMADESHKQNLDILKHLERTEKQVELLRKTEKEILLQNKELEENLKKKEYRIQTLEEQLNEERENVAKMVPREEYEEKKEKIRQCESRYRELEEQLDGMRKDYLSIVDTYSKSVGHKANTTEMRPLTPRPRWRHCRGLLDLLAPRSLDKAESSQTLLQHLLVGQRTVLSEYGLGIAASKSPVLEQYTNHPLTLPLSMAEADERKPTAEEQDEMSRPTMEDQYLLPDLADSTPEPLRHESEVKNLCLSRKHTSDFLEKIMLIRAERSRSEPSYTVPFLEYMMKYLADEAGDDSKALKKAEDKAINIFASVRRFAKEPDFLSYLLLLKGKLGDTSVKSNKDMCAELLRIFATHFEAEGTRYIPKHRFFNNLRELLQNKDQKMWQDLVTYFPAGGPDVSVNYESLLLDDMYVLSPIAYALRLQHLEESMEMAERLETAVRGTVKPPASTVKYHKVREALADDPEFSLLLPEDYAKAFITTTHDLKPGSEQDVGVFLELMKHGDAFHIFFPVIPSDDAELPSEGGM